MGFDLLLAMTIAYYLTKNTVQDLAWKARGEDPPSFRREQARRERRGAADGPGRRFWANVWADAVASAEERRARIAARSAERRRAKWADADLDAAEVEAREINERLDKGSPETVYTCGGCQASLPQSDVAGVALSGDLLCRTCRTAPQTPATRPTPKRPEIPASAGPTEPPVDAPITAADALCPHCFAQSKYDWDRGVINIIHEPHCPRSVPASPEAKAGSEDAPSGGTVTDLAEWRSRGATPPITKEDLVSGETTNLSAALFYTQEMADKCGAGAASCETSIATLQSADVSGDVITQLTQAQEALNQAMAAFNAAHADLTSQLSVKDAYMANTGAGDKQFVMQD